MKTAATTTGLLQYIRLKIIVLALRTFVGWQQAQRMKRDLVLSEDITRSQLRIPSRDDGRFIDAWLYYPPSYSAVSSQTWPILVNWHGSGFVIPSLGSDRAFCARIARDAGIVVLDADYQKGPETPFPGALHDVEDTLKWVGGQITKYDLTRVALSGFSAGGNLALVAASAMRNNLDTIRIPVVIAVYPPTDLSIDPGAKSVPSPCKPIPAAVARVFDDCYVPDKLLRADPQVSPALANSALFPDTVAIFTCSGDNLSPESNALAQKLIDGKRTIVNMTLENVHHAFDKGCIKGTNEWHQRELLYSTSARILQEAFQTEP